MMKTCFISASPLSPQARAFQNTSPAGVLIMPFTATTISCLPPKHYFFGTTLHSDLTHFPCRKNFMFGKPDYWRIYFSVAGRAALRLWDSCCEGCRRKAADSSSCALAGAARLAQSSSCRVFSYVPRKMKPPRLMAAIRGTTPANKLKARKGTLRGWKTKPRKTLSWFLKSQPTAQRRNLSGLPRHSTPKSCGF